MLNEAEILGTSTTEEVRRDTQTYPYRTNQHDRNRPHRGGKRRRRKSFHDDWHNRPSRSSFTIGPIAATLLFTLILALWIWNDKFP
ncbi:hypothetical protein Halhy_4905 [Haliscomenobacter hydrossis DSM 1100]|uniref:Uncharacterized protein n=1 Tax=Haliscomenobacter hydrossis (strain ATCC 27775 / DSM 1100 / LMG 10767 / O) TaxID=760192 RepID=F4L025_HALH1|nr:hypothetical protein Halhy_4905 [Haliscomenobacter hydrossis DSM 1100]